MDIKRSGQNGVCKEIAAYNAVFIGLNLIFKVFFMNTQLRLNTHFALIVDPIMIIKIKILCFANISIFIIDF